jgi:hypothetical protein
MNDDPDPPLEDEFASRLAEHDEAMAVPTAATARRDGTVPPELKARLERGLACVQLLQQLRPQRPSCTAFAPETPGPAAVDSDEAPATADSPCPARLGRFEIRRPLGRGGFGIVYLAYDPVLCRQVALKIPRPDALADAECRARFQQEARAAAGLDHPNLVPVHEAGQLGPICYIALAYCPGDNLAEWLKQRTTLVACDQAARLLVTLAQAVHYAHTRGILHRDLKPSNVLLSPLERSEVPLTDPADSDCETKGNVWLSEPATGYIPRLRSDANRGRAWHALLHGPRAGGRANSRRRSADRRVRVGRHPLRAHHGPSAIRRRHGARDALASENGRTSAAESAATQGAARPGNDLSEVLAERASQALRDCGGSGGGFAAVVGR